MKKNEPATRAFVREELRRQLQGHVDLLRKAEAIEKGDAMCKAAGCSGGMHKCAMAKDDGFDGAAPMAMAEGRGGTSIADRAVSEGGNGPASFLPPGPAPKSDLMSRIRIHMTPRKGIKYVTTPKTRGEPIAKAVSAEGPTVVAGTKPRATSVRANDWRPGTTVVNQPPKKTSRLASANLNAAPRPWEKGELAKTGDGSAPGWHAKVHRVIAQMARKSYEQTNTNAAGERYKRHRPYSLPDEANQLVGHLGDRDQVRGERGAKEVMEGMRRRGMVIDQVSSQKSEKSPTKEIRTGTVEVKPAPGAELPPEKVPVVGGDGSGGDVKRGKLKKGDLQKDATSVAFGVQRPKAVSLPAPKMPGMTPAGPRPTPAAKPAGRAEGLHAPASDATLAADKAAAGVGLLRNLITRFRGIGAKTWSAPSNHSSTSGAVRAMGTRMARSEINKAAPTTTDKQIGTPGAGGYTIPGETAGPQTSKLAGLHGAMARRAPAAMRGDPKAHRQWLDRMHAAVRREDVESQRSVKKAAVADDEWEVHEGQPSWHQARAGHTSAGKTTGFKSRGEAEAWVANANKHRADKGMPDAGYHVRQAVKRIQKAAVTPAGPAAAPKVVAAPQMKTPKPPQAPKAPGAK